MQVLLGLEQGAIEGRHQFARLAGAHRLGAISSANSSRIQSSSSEVEGFCAALYLAQLEEEIHRLTEQALLEVWVVELDDGLHLGLVGEADVVEEAAAQEGIRQLLLVVGGDDDHLPLLGLDALAGLVDVELHPIQLLQQIVGELDVRLVDFIDEQHRALVGGEGLPQLAPTDVVADLPTLGSPSWESRSLATASYS